MLSLSSVVQCCRMLSHVVSCCLILSYVVLYCLVLSHVVYNVNRFFMTVQDRLNQFELQRAGLHPDWVVWKCGNAQDHLGWFSPDYLMIDMLISLISLIPRINSVQFLVCPFQTQIIERAGEFFPGRQRWLTQQNSMVQLYWHICIIYIYIYIQTLYQHMGIQ